MATEITPNLINTGSAILGDVWTADGSGGGSYTTIGGGGAGGGLVFLGSATASNSVSIEFKSLITSTYDHYIFYFSAIHPVTNLVDFQMAFSTDNGVTYNTSGLTRYQNVAKRVGGATRTITGAQTNNFLLNLGVANNTNGHTRGKLELFDPLSTGYSSVNWDFSNVNSANQFIGAGQFLTPTAIDAFKFLFSSGNISTGSIYMFGVVKS